MMENNFEKGCIQSIYITYHFTVYLKLAQHGKPTILRFFKTPWMHYSVLKQDPLSVMQPLRLMGSLCHRPHCLLFFILGFLLRHTPTHNAVHGSNATEIHSCDDPLGSLEQKCPFVS